MNRGIFLNIFEHPGSTEKNCFRQMRSCPLGSPFRARNSSGTQRPPLRDHGSLTRFCKSARNTDLCFPNLPNAEFCRGLLRRSEMHPLYNSAIQLCRLVRLFDSRSYDGIRKTFRVRLILPIPKSVRSRSKFLPFVIKE